MSKRYKDLPLKEVKELLKKLPPNVKIRVYYEDEEDQSTIMKPSRKKKSKYTLDQIGDALFEFIRTTNERFDRIDTRLDYIVKANNLKDLPRK